jgi:DNA invertase Pin-like site-specific DNA recombinase
MAQSNLPRAAIYARVSTTEQNPGLQTRELEEYAERRGWTITDRYIDHGVSGSKDSRPELNRLLADCRRRRVDVVLVWKIDRWGRSLKHLVTSLADLDAVGVAFVSLRDNLDLGTPSGRLMMQLLGAMAEFERALIQERVCAGIRNARARGKRLGRPVVIADSARIADLREQGRSWSAIARELGLKETTVRNRAAAWVRIKPSPEEREAALRAFIDAPGPITETPLHQSSTLAPPLSA